MENPQSNSKGILYIIAIITAIFGSIEAYHKAYPPEIKNNTNFQSVISMSSSAQETNGLLKEYKQLDWKCSIKWNLSFPDKEKIYHIPTCTDYIETKINIKNWERYFCTQQEAINAGFRISKNCK